MGGGGKLKQGKEPIVGRDVEGDEIEASVRSTLLRGAAGHGHRESRLDLAEHGGSPNGE